VRTAAKVVAAAALAAATTSLIFLCYYADTINRAFTSVLAIIGGKN